jgi:hypothetical protein
VYCFGLAYQLVHMHVQIWQFIVSFVTAAWEKLQEFKFLLIISYQYIEYSDNVYVLRSTESYRIIDKIWQEIFAVLTE